MDTRLTTIHGLSATSVWRTVAALLVTVVLVAMLGATSVTAASPTACRVQNAATGKTYAALQAAVDAASRGDRLTVMGTCIGGTVIDRNLIIVGVLGQAPGTATLSGAGKTRVVIVQKGVRVVMRDLVIRGGKVTHGQYDEDRKGGAGVRSQGTLTLSDVVVRGNSATPWGDGGGIYNAGRLTLDGSTSITGNTAEWGGGLYNHEGATLVMNDASRISRNTSTNNAGGVANYMGTLVMNDASRISRNTATRLGGGVSVQGGTLVMNDASRISGNTVTEGRGGGVFRLGATLRGVVCAPRRGANVIGNDPDECHTERPISSR